MGPAGAAKIGSVIVRPCTSWISSRLAAIFLVVAVVYIPRDSSAAVGIGGGVERYHGCLGAVIFGESIAVLHDVAHLRDETDLVGLRVGRDPIGLGREGWVICGAEHRYLLVADDRDGERSSSEARKRSCAEKTDAAETVDGADHRMRLK